MLGHGRDQKRRFTAEDLVMHDVKTTFDWTSVMMQ